MNSTEVKIIVSATNAFTEGGVRGTNMSKVARGAGVSRQTLYAHYGSKDELLLAVMRQALADMLVKIQTTWRDCATLSDKLDVFFEVMIVEPFEILQRHPDLKDLLLGVGGKTAEIVCEAEQVKAAALATELGEYAAQLEHSGSSPVALASFIVRVGKELKFSNPNRTELDQNIDILKKCILALVEKPTGSAHE